MKNNTAFELIEVITNKINPPYEKEITELDFLKNKVDNIKKLNPSFLNLRGVLKEEFNYCDMGYNSIENKDSLLALENNTFLDSINSIVKLDNNFLALASGSSVCIVEIKSLKIISKLDTQNQISSIAVIDENHIAFGGSDGKVTIANISDKQNPKVYEKSISVGNSVYSIVKDDEKVVY